MRKSYLKRWTAKEALEGRKIRMLGTSPERSTRAMSREAVGGRSVMKKPNPNLTKAANHL